MDNKQKQEAFKEILVSTYVNAQTNKSLTLDDLLKQITDQLKKIIK
ncbi:hypothetical protein [Bacillus kwashiorkori]|nr:hypothetical protein [Bacillus kwashiorkori]